MSDRRILPGLGAIVLVAVIALAVTRSSDGDTDVPEVVAAPLIGESVTTIAPLLGATETFPIEPTSTEPSPVAVEQTPTTAPVEVAEEVPMDQLLIDDRTLVGVLADMELAPDALLGTGPLDLEAAVAIEADGEAERALLTTRGFEEGFSRGFTNTDGDTVIVQVYRFADADGAAAYVVDGAEQLLGRGASPYDVAPLPGALGFSGNDGGFEAHGVTYAVGRHHVLVVVGGAEGNRSAEEARLVALAQHEHLLALVR
ncbi:MAG: hypothetical protein AAGA99_20285 [Actinomycetota bacterium]